MDSFFENDVIYNFISCDNRFRNCDNTPRHFIIVNHNGEKIGGLWFKFGNYILDNSNHKNI